MKIKIRRGVLVVARLSLAMCLVQLFLATSPTLAQTSPLSAPSLYFAQTGHSVSQPFLNYWQQNGGLTQFGYPVSDEFFDGYKKVQYFERARFEYHPELAGTLYQVELGLLGSEALIRAGRTFPSVPDPNDKNVYYFKETGHTLASPFLDYWLQHGGLAVFGFPLSEKIQEQSPTDGKTYYVQYFERNRFEYHPEFTDPAYQVELGLLGSESLKLNQPAAPVATVSLDGNQHNSAVGNLVGANIESLRYTLPGENLHPDWSQTNPQRILQLTQQLQPGSDHTFALSFGTQFDGGRMTGTRAGGANGYHWRDAFQSSYGFMNVDEVAGFAKQLTATLAVMVNFGSANAQEAADEVAYTNGTDTTNANVALRQQHGATAPYNVTHWYIGGAVFDAGETGFSSTGDYSYANPNSKNGGDPAWFNKPTSDPANYAARAVTFARAMRAASPVPIKIYLQIAVPGSAWGGIRSQLQTLIAGAGTDVDGFVLNLYPVGEGQRTGLDDLDILGSPQRALEWIQEAQNNLKALAPTGKQYELITTEYNVAIHNISQLNNLAGGLAIAGMVAGFANQGVSLATHYSLETDTYGFYYYNNDNTIGTPRPSYLALQLLGNHLGAQLVPTTVTGSPIQHGPGGTLVPGFDYPTLLTTASISGDGQRLYVVAINRDPHQALPVAFNFSNVQIHTNTSIAATMLNGLDLDSTSDPAHAGNVGLVTADFAPADPTHFNFQLPAHSAVAFTFTLNK